jgi:putative ABC transport system permease protein
MLKNFTLLFLRNLRRQKLFSAINLLGLTVSMASTLLIYLYVRHELSYDNFHEGADRTYRVNQTFIWAEKDNHQFGSTGPGVAFALKEELAEIELISRLHTQGDQIVTWNDGKGNTASYVETRVVTADSNFFRMFNFPMIKGNPAMALTHAQTIVLSESMAKKYFGDLDPIGQVLKVGTSDQQRDFEVTGIVKDIPGNTYIEFDMLLSMASFPVITRMSWSWVWTQLETYVRFKPGTNIENTRAKLTLIPRKHAEATLKAAMGVTYDEYVKSGKRWELFLQPLTGIHLPPETVYNRIGTAGNITIIYALIGSAAFILLLSCVNFMNLSTAQFLRRMKEASIRKILGISRSQLTIQSFGEALTFCALALIAGLAIAQIMLPAFNTLSGKQLSIDPINDVGLVIALAALVLIMAMLSGTYPAIFLTSLNPVEAIKGKMRTGQEGKTLRHSLVVFQFSASIVLILCTAIVFDQLQFVNTKNLGFDKDNLIVLNNVEVTRSREGLAEAIRGLNGVNEVTRATSLPPYIWGGDTFTASGMDGKMFSMNFTSTEENFLPSFGVKLLFGRNFSADIPADTGRLIVNVSTVQRIGWPVDEKVVGKEIQYDNTRFEIIGVVSDFNYWPLQTEIEPLGIFHMKSGRVVGEGSREFIGIRMNSLNPEQWQAMLGELASLWKVHAPDSPFEYQFVEDNFAKAFKNESQFGKALTVMAVLAILIASLGLLGMIVYSLELRTKEIGIRKVAGASVWNILTLISRSYTYLILVAFAVGAPLSFWMMDKWLGTFAYRITPSPWLFAGVGVGTLVVAISITLYHSMKAALTNPVDVLKDE